MPFFSGRFFFPGKGFSPGRFFLWGFLPGVAAFAYTAGRPTWQSEVSEEVLHLVLHAAAVGRAAAAPPGRVRAGCGAAWGRHLSRLLLLHSLQGTRLVVCGHTGRTHTIDTEGHTRNTRWTHDQNNLGGGEDSVLFQEHYCTQKQPSKFLTALTTFCFHFLFNF